MKKYKHNAFKFCFTDGKTGTYITNENIIDARRALAVNFPNRKLKRINQLNNLE